MKIAKMIVTIIIGALAITGIGTLELPRPATIALDAVILLWVGYRTYSATDKREE